LKARRGHPRREALGILARVEEGAWSHRLLASVQARLPAADDRRFLHHLVLETLRWQGALDRVVEPHVHGGFRNLDPLVRAALRMGLLQAARMDRPAAIAVSSTVEALKVAGAGRACSLVNAVLRKALLGGAPRLDAMQTIPAWIRRRWECRFGLDKARSIVRACLEPAPSTIIVRPDGPDRSEVLNTLVERGAEVRISHFHPLALEIERAGRRSAPQGEREGPWLMMDAASALVAYLTRPEVEGPIVDLAAAPGGKAALAAMLWSKPVLAAEKNPARTLRMAERFHRLAEACASSALRETETLVADATASCGREATAGVVLLDAPCSGTGTMRRRPEIRHRLTIEQIDHCRREQERMLDAAARWVRPGGALVYSVCSIEVEEGRTQVSAFLARHPGFIIEDPRKFLPLEAHDLVSSADVPLLETLPGEEGMDGFVAARFRRV